MDGSGVISAIDRLGESPVLVLGAGGRLGRMCRQYWPMDHDLISQSRQIGLGDVRFDPLLDQSALIAAARGKRAVVCLAGVVPKGTKEPSVDFGLNSDLACAAVQAAKAAGCPRVFLASSAAVYGRQIGPLSETTRPCPNGAYGRSKLRMEEEAHAIGIALDQPVTSLRIGNVAGADAILGGWHRRMRIDQLPDGTTPRRSYTGGVDLAKLICQLTWVPHVPPVLNVALSGAIEARSLLDAAGLPWSYRQARADVIPDVTLNVDLLGRVLGHAVPEVNAVKLVSEWQSGPRQQACAV
ncbi:NAD-dependent epimerase/dehydratase family protein [Sulfitobacter mediterraneus]|uniref:NAD-dependent epimerase/dehydratase family protein n=1 Tax=Sulfitobacter mediterraneus TaxID=83219 RepID=UPI000EA2F60A|nr:NAD(P)-dependent oxidoreductase [Sulfitobacter mediterraneus]